MVASGAPPFRRFLAGYNGRVPEHPLHPPVARRVPKVDFLHGDKREDDYDWLRQKTDPEVVAYLHAENAYGDAVMRPTEEFREALYAEMLGRLKEDDSSVPARRGRHVYYSRTEKGKQYPIYCRRLDAPDAPEEITLDLNVLAEGRAFISLGAYQVSDDGNLLAFSLDYTGFREYTLRVKNLASGDLYPDEVQRVSSVAWAADGATLFYVMEDEAKRPYRLYRHRLGSDPALAHLVYEETDALFRLGVWRSRSKDFLFAAARSFTSGEARFLSAADPEAAWTLLHAREKDHEIDVDHGGAFFYLRSNGDGLRNFRLVRVPVAAPRRDRWDELIPHREDVMLEDVDVFAGHYVTHERVDGLIRLRVTALEGGEAHDIDFPEPTYDVSPETNAEFVTREYRFRYQSFVTPSSVYDHDVVERKLTLRKRTEVLGGYDPTRYRSERVWATAPDGVRVPISLVMRADAPRDGSVPMLLSGYGAYGIPYPVTFASTRLSLLDRGVSVGVAHVRGGGELGKRWHDAGRMLDKRHTFTDFIAAAEHVAREGYTAADRLVVDGGSAGGLLIGAVLNMRPEAVHAAVLRVPFVDVINTMLDESLPLTVGEFEEWGNPKIREHYEYMKTYCPYTNVDRRPYPSILVRTSLNDSQVMYWEPAKYIAALRARNDGAPFALFKIDMDSGHGGPSGRYDALRETAFDYAFVLTQVGRAGG
jgi:oligopeptidase B